MRHAAGIGRRSKVYDAAMRQRAIAIVVVVASCLLLAACNSSGSDSDASTTTTTIAPPPTAVATTTEPPASSTEAPTTTINTEAQLAAAEQAYLDAFDAYIAAARDPSNPELRAEIERLYTGPNLESTVSRLDRFVERGITSREQPGSPSFAVVQEGPSFSESGDELIELIACEVDAERLVEIGAAPDGGDALVSDEVVVERILVRSRLIDGVWKSESGELLDDLSSPDECSA